MPLKRGTSNAVVSKNISEMVHAGHPQDQAVAAAMRMKDESGKKKGMSKREQHAHMNKLIRGAK